MFLLFDPLSIINAYVETINGKVFCTVGSIKRISSDFNDPLC